jgi:hypothetical protein
MNEFPLRNEPGFERESILSKRSIQYNKIIEWYNWKFAIKQMLVTPPTPGLGDIINTLYVERKETYEKMLNKLQETTTENIRINLWKQHANIDYGTESL